MFGYCPPGTSLGESNRTITVFIAEKEVTKLNTTSYKEASSGSERNSKHRLLSVTP